MKRIIILCLTLFSLTLPVLSQDPYCGLDEHWELLPNQLQVFQVEVSGYLNDRLDNPGQGLCSVELGFTHNALKDLEIWLESPAGQRIQLIGPNVDGSLPTLGANWQLSFLPSDEQAEPQPGGYAARWTNDQAFNFAITGRGSYFPYDGDLEDLNTGPVNGLWTVRVQANPTAAFISGIIYHFRLVFCDDSGTACCFSEAGVLSGVEDVVACAGDAALDIPVPDVRYLFSRRPDEALHGYRFLIVRDGVVVELTDDPDLTAYGLGDYQIFGLSYASSDEAILNSLDIGVLTLADLRADLEGPSPSFCGDLTDDDPIQIRIVTPQLSIAAPEVLTCDRKEVTLDAGASIPAGTLEFRWLDPSGNDIGNGPAIVVDRPGIYRLEATLSGGGCPEISSVEVFEDVAVPTAAAVGDGEITCLLREAVLDGSGSSTGPDFSYSWSSPDGSFSSPADLLSPTVDAPGTYTLVVTDGRNGCTASAQAVVGGNLALPVADAGGPAAVLTCELAQVSLGGPGTSQGLDFSYRWSSPDGRFISPTDGPQAEADAPGTYSLLVIDTRNGCEGRDQVTVLEDKTIPQADAGNDTALTCAAREMMIGGPSTSRGPEFAYTWVSPDGSFLSAIDIPQPVIDAPGTYTLSVEDLRNGCTASSVVNVGQDFTEPVADAGLPMILTCASPDRLIGGDATSLGPDFQYRWTSADGRLVSGDQAPKALVDAPGTYELLVTDTRNGCSGSAQVNITEDKARPLADPGPEKVITCRDSVLRLEGDNSDFGPSFNVLWRTANGRIVGGAGTLTPLVDQAGDYELVVANTVNGCRDSAMVRISEDLQAPVAAIAEPALLNCERRAVEIDASSSDKGPGFAFSWHASEGGMIPPGEELSLTPSVTEAGRYELVILDEANSCRDTAVIFVRDTSSTIFADAGPDQVPDCAASGLVLDGSGSVGGPDVDYYWSTADGEIDSEPGAVSVTVSAPGTYVLTLTDRISACTDTDSVRVDLAAGSPNAVLADSSYLDCVSGTAVLDAGRSSGDTFSWYKDGVALPGTGPVLQVTETGRYQVVVSAAVPGCSDTAEAVVLPACGPLAFIAKADTLTCIREVLTLDARASSQGEQIIYEWTAPRTGCLVSGADGLQPVVRCGGTYSLIVSDTVLLLSDTAVVTVAADTVEPVAEAGTAEALTCTATSVILNATGSSTGPGMLYSWLNKAGDTLSQSLVATTFSPGIHLFEVVDRRNGCRSQDSVLVLQEGAVPEIRFPEAVFPCDQDTFRLQSIVEPPNVDYRYSWTGPEIAGEAESPAVLITGAGVYQLRVEDPENACSASASVTVMAEACGICAEILPPDTLTCAADTVRLTAAFCEDCPGCTVSWTTADGQILAGANTLTPLVGAAAVYTLTVEDGGGVSAVLQVAVPEERTPPPALAGPEQVLTCALSEVTLGAEDGTSFYRYRWLRTDGMPVEGETNRSQLAVALPGEYVVEMEDLRNGCVASDTVLIGENYSTPFAEAGEPRELTCLEPMVTLDGSASSPGDHLTYQWAAADGGPVAGEANTLNPLVDRPGLYRLTVTDQESGCSASDSTLVGQALDLPVLPELRDQLLTCSADSVILEAGIPDVSGYAFEWCRLDEGGTPVDCSESLRITADQPGFFQFALTDLSSGCTSTEVVEVVGDLDLPQVEAGPALNLVCGQEGGVLQGGAGPQGASLTYRWTSPAGHPIENGTSLSPTVFMPGIYYLIVTDDVSGCVATDSVSVFRDEEAPVVAISEPELLTCSRPSIILAAQASTVSGNVIWQWRSEEGRFLSGTDTAFPEVDLPGLYEVSVTDPANGCTSTRSVGVVADREKPLAAVDSSGGFLLNCFDPLIRLDATPSLSVSGEPMVFSWRVISGSPVIGNPSAPVVEVNQAGVYRLVVTEVNNGCRDTLELNVQDDGQVPLADISASASSITCDLEQVQLTATDFSLQTGLHYVWRDGAGDPIAENVPLLTVFEGSTYQLSVFDPANGCSDTASISIQVDTVRPVVRIAVPEQLDCAATSVELDGGGTSSGSDLAYSWFTFEGNIVDGQSAPIALVDEPGLYLLKVRDVGNGCFADDSVRVRQVEDAISEVFVSVEAPGCEGENTGVIRVDSVRGGDGPYVYALNDDFFSTPSFFTRLVSGDYRLRVQDSKGCEWEQEVRVPEQEKLQVDLGQDRLIRLGDTIVLTAEITGGVYEIIKWLPGEAFEVQGKPRQILRPLQTTTYSVVVEGAGCRASDNISITVAKGTPVYLPTAFSPDGDGINDVFFLQAGQEVASIREFQIFDRWGKLVFQRTDFLPNDPASGWDGKHNGQLLNPAVFVFFAEVALIDGTVGIWKGDVALVR